MIIAAGLLGVFAATGTAPASSLSTLHTFKAVCAARDGYFGYVDRQAVCQLPTGQILTMSPTDSGYDYAPAPAPSFSIYFGSHHHCKPLREQMLTGSGGDCRDRMPIESKPIEMGKPILKGLYHK